MFYPDFNFFLFFLFSPFADFLFYWSGRSQFCGVALYCTWSYIASDSSPAAFHKHFDHFFQNDGWEPLEADSCVYIKYGADGKVAAIAATFVDNTVVTGTDEALAEYQKFMQSGFTISDVGTPEDFLGMQIEYNRKNKKIKLDIRAWQLSAAL